MSLRVAKCWGEFCVGIEHGRKEPDKHPADLYRRPCETEGEKVIPLCNLS